MTSSFPLRFAFLLALIWPLGGCDSFGLKSEAVYENKQKTELYKNGSLLDTQGGVTLFGGTSKKMDEPEPRKTPESSGLGVNAYLWRASLDTLAFMPILTVDSSGGVILTDWHTAPAAPNERVKLNVFILDRDLRADGLRVTAFRQTRGADGVWVDATLSPSTARQIEETILTRARQMKLDSKSVEK